MKAQLVVYRIASIEDPRKIEELVRVPEDTFRRLVIDLLCRLRWRTTVTYLHEVPPMIWHALVECLPMEDILTLFPRLDRAKLHLLDVLFVYNYFEKDEPLQQDDDESSPYMDHLTNMELHYLATEYYLLRLKDAFVQEEEEERMLVNVVRVERSASPRQHRFFYSSGDDDGNHESLPPPSLSSSSSSDEDDESSSSDTVSLHDSSEDESDRATPSVPPPRVPKFFDPKEKLPAETKQHRDSAAILRLFHFAQFAYE